MSYDIWFQFSHSIMFNSLRPHGLHHARLPCPSQTPRACSNSCPSSQWCHPTISSSVIPFSSCFSLSQHQMVTATTKLKHTCSLEEKSYDKPRQHIKKQRHYFADKGPSSQSYGFSCSHVWMWELDHKESWALKNWCFWTMVLEKILESPLNSKEIKPVNPKGNQSWIFVGRTDAEAEGLILWSHVWYNTLIFGYLLPSWASLWLSNKESACQCRRHEFDP